MKTRVKIYIILLIIIISSALHFDHFSKDLTGIHVWRQTQTQSTINNFFEEDMNILNPRRNERGNGDGIFRMEFPLMQWMVAGIYKIFEKNIVITRLFMFLTGLFSVFGIYKLLDLIFRNKILALIGAWAFNFSPCFYFYTINPLPDNLALCFSIWGIAMFLLWYRKQNQLLLIFSSLLLALGTLCKLPFLLYYIIPISYFLITYIKKGFLKNQISNLVIIASSALLPAAWYLSVISNWEGNGIVQGIFKNQNSGNQIAEYVAHNLISTLPELLLNYASVPFFFAGFYFLFKNKAYKNEVFIMLIIWSLALLLYFFYEINMIGKDHDYYLFPFYPILFIIVSYGAYNLFISNLKIFRYMLFALLILMPFTAFIRNQKAWNTEAPGFNKDLLRYKHELRSHVPNDALCISGNDQSQYIFHYYIDKKGWSFHDENLNKVKLEKMIDEGAQFLYSDSREIEKKIDIKNYSDSLYAKFGSVHIYRLLQKTESN